MDAEIYGRLADGVLTLHVLFVIFVVFGLPLIFIGGRIGWPWIRNRALRLAHLAAIGIVTVQAWAGIVCPLTTLEMYWRRLAGEEIYGGTFIAYWLGRCLYVDAPPWAFTVAYTTFGALVALSWILVRPEPWTRADP